MRDPSRAACGYNRTTFEVTVLLSLCLPAFALTVPVRATFKETVEPGERALASATTTAVTTAFSTTTGKAFVVSDDELTANKREASGNGGLSFHTSPANSVRTWAVYYIDADGAIIGEPDVVTMSFDSSGNGNVAAGTGSRLGALGVSPKKGGGTGQWYGATSKVSVQDSGANAAYIGIAELSSSIDGTELVPDPDMDAMDAGVFATFQEKALEAILPLSQYHLQLDGSVTIDGLSVSSAGVVEGGANIEWDIGFYSGEVTCEKGGACTPAIAETLSWFEPIGTVKKKGTVAPRVNLKDADVVFETYDAGLELTIAGDVRSLEISAAMEIYEAEKLVAASDIVTLDPTGYGVQGKAGKDKDDTGIIIDIFIDTDTDVLDGLDRTGPPAGSPVWAYFSNDVYTVTLVDGKGTVVAENECTLSPTARTVAGTSKRQNLLGECTTDPSGTEVRRLLLSLGSGGYMYWMIDMASPAFAQTTTDTTCKAANCAGSTVLDGVVEISRGGDVLYRRSLQVNETDFALPFAFEGISDGLDGSVAIDVYTPGAATWTVTDGIATATDPTGVIASFALDDIGLIPTGDVVVNGWSADEATAPAAESKEPLSLSKTGPGKHVIRVSR